MTTTLMVATLVLLLITISVGTWSALDQARMQKYVQWNLDYVTRLNNYSTAILSGIENDDTRWYAAGCPREPAPKPLWPRRKPY